MIYLKNSLLGNTLCQAKGGKVIAALGSAPIYLTTVSPGHQLELLNQVRAAVRTHHGSDRAEKTYIRRIKRFILFHGKGHPEELETWRVGRGGV